MKKAQLDINMSLSVSLNILRVHRWINRHLSRRVRPRWKSGDRRYRMAFAANARRIDQNRLFRFNGFRNAIRKR